MNISSNKDKQNRLCEIWHAQPNTVAMVDYPGNYAKCVGSFTELKFSDASFEESDVENGSPIQQNLEITINGQNQESDNESLDLTSNYLILKLLYTNGDIKILGTKDNPVTLLSNSTGTPAALKLYTQRISAEKAKYLLI